MGQVNFLIESGPKKNVLNQVGFRIFELALKSNALNVLNFFAIFFDDSSKWSAPNEVGGSFSIVENMNKSN